MLVGRLIVGLGSGVPGEDETVLAEVIGLGVETVLPGGA
jgi:hypothetical protein